MTPQGESVRDPLVRLEHIFGLRLFWRPWWSYQSFLLIEHLRPSPTMLLLCHDPIVFWLEKLQEDIVRLLDSKDIVRLPSRLRKPLKSS